MCVCPGMGVTDSRPDHARAARDVTVGAGRQRSGTRGATTGVAALPSSRGRVVDTRQSVMAVSVSVMVFVHFKGFVAVAITAAAATAVSVVVDIL